MKLLFDHNLSPALVSNLSDIFPESDHVYALDLHQLADVDIWEYANRNEFTIVTKDADFSDLSTLLGFPPKVVWIRRGNCRSAEIENIFRDNERIIRAFVNESRLGLITFF